VTGIVTVHSFSRGVGKTTLSVNIASLLAAKGCRVALLDLDIALPSAHLFFGLDEDEVTYSLNDYLAGICEIEHAMHDLSARFAFKGKLFLLPASIKLADINRLMRQGYPAERLVDSCDQLVARLGLDALIIDCQAGLTETTLPAIALADVLLHIMRLDRRDYQGTGVSIDIAHKLAVSNVYLLANMVPSGYTPDEVTAKLAQTYHDPVLAALPYAEELSRLASSEVFVLRYPHHALTKRLQSIADHLLAACAPGGT
jgi:MinD-like ATPase involved in chromosome partitioning or flagellar assembly